MSRPRQRTREGRTGSAQLYGTLQSADAVPDSPLPEGVTVESLRETGEHIVSIIEPLESARMSRDDAGIIRDAFANAARMMLHACERGTAMLEGTIDSAEKRAQLATEMRTILGEHRRLWGARNRVGGLQDSESVFENRLQEYAGTA